MIVAIMQPYFFPYIGYFQLMAAVDTFVFLDDVQYVHRSWMNRNRIGLDGKSVWLSMPVLAGSRTAHINERLYVPEAGEALLRKIDAAYRDAPGYRDGRGLIADLLRHPDRNVATFNAHLLKVVADALGVRPRMLRSSDVRSRNHARGQAGILELCRLLRASRYVNAIGGVGLYENQAFLEAGVELAFLRTRVPPSDLADGSVHLSIIDGLMRSGPAGCSTMVAACEVLEPSEASNRDFREAL